MPHPKANLTPDQVPTDANSILLVDWSSRDVPETLVRPGHTVLVKGWTRAGQLLGWGATHAEVLVVKLAPAPGHVDIV
jgi:hypothetical protein